MSEKKKNSLDNDNVLCGDSFTKWLQKWNGTLI